MFAPKSHMCYFDARLQRVTSCIRYSELAISYDEIAYSVCSSNFYDPKLCELL